jgi:hypothetical protein
MHSVQLWTPTILIIKVGIIYKLLEGKEGGRGGREGIVIPTPEALNCFEGGRQQLHFEPAGIEK